MIESVLLGCLLAVDFMSHVMLSCVSLCILLVFDKRTVYELVNGAAHLASVIKVVSICESRCLLPADVNCEVFASSSHSVHCRRHAPK